MKNYWFSWLFFSDSEEIKKILELDWSSDDSTLYIVLDKEILLSLLQIGNSTYYSFNSWLIVLFNNNSDNISPESFLRNILTPFQSLRLDSRLYFLIFEGNSDASYNASLFEAYRCVKLLPQNFTTRWHLLKSHLI